MNTKGHALDSFKINPGLSAWANWERFIAIQEGGLSDWKGDTASANMPPKPHTDGKYYHTNRGWTYPTWYNVRKAAGLSTRPEEFYTMSRADSNRLMKIYFRAMKFDKISESDVINIFCFYINWGGGWFARWNKWFTQVHGQSFATAIKTETNTGHIFKDMVTARKKDLLSVRAKSYPDYPKLDFYWLGAIEIFSREFSKIESFKSGIDWGGVAVGLAAALIFFTPKEKAA